MARSSTSSARSTIACSSSCMPPRVGLTGSDDVARHCVSEDGGLVGPVGGECREVAAEHGVDCVLDPFELALATRAPHRLPDPLPVDALREVQRRVALVQGLQVTNQPEQLGAQEGEVAAGLVLVLDGAVEPEQHDGRRVRVDLHGTTVGSGVRRGVEPKLGDQAQPAAAVGELRSARVAWMSARVVPPEHRVELRLARAPTGRVGDDERPVDRDHARAVGPRPQPGEDLLVGAHGASRAQPIAMHGCQTCRVARAPGEVDAQVRRARHAGRPSQVRSRRISRTVSSLPSMESSRESCPARWVSMDSRREPTVSNCRS